MLSPLASRKIVAFIAVLSCFFLVFQTLTALRFVSVRPYSPETDFLAFLLLFFAFPFIAAWSVFRRWAGVAIGCIALFLATLAFITTGNGLYLAYYVFFGGLYALTNWYGKKAESQLMVDEVEMEKFEGEKNQLETLYRDAMKEVEASLSKYSAYYALREVAERLAVTLDLSQVTKQVLKEMRDFVPNAETYLLYLAEIERLSLSLIASYSAREEEKIKAKTGDVCDLWVLKNRQPLLVTDTTNDVRFDTHRIPRKSVRSVMIAPLLAEGRVVGIARADSSLPHAFQTDAFRVFDALSVLASAAIANALLYEKTEELAIRDSLTGLYVQRYFRERLSEEHGRALMSKTPLSLLMCDLDFFKNYNDAHGHGAGDIMLGRVAEIIRDAVGEEGLVARYGGEEFAVLLPRWPKQDAAALAERIRSRIEKELVEVRREMTSMTISIGVSTIPVDTLEREDLIRRADQNLYAAKHLGRNKVVVG